MRSPSGTLVTSQAPGPKPRRRGCLGCLWQAPIMLALGLLLVLAITGVFAPWAFYLGGNFHILPYWQGGGKLHAKSGDYVMDIPIEPTSRGSRMYLDTTFGANACLFTP